MTAIGACEQVVPYLYFAALILGMLNLSWDDFSGDRRSA